jgi:MFS transporter, MHS family, citrate/tricarballylate:H+ symporter
LAWLVNAPSFRRLMAVELWFSLLFASYNAAMMVFLTEITPTDGRTAGLFVAPGACLQQLTSE